MVATKSEVSVVTPLLLYLYIIHLLIRRNNNSNIHFQRAVMLAFSQTTCNSLEHTPRKEERPAKIISCLHVTLAIDSEFLQSVMICLSTLDEHLQVFNTFAVKDERARTSQASGCVYARSRERSSLPSRAMPEGRG